jgi:hypothetical protein
MVETSGRQPLTAEAHIWTRVSKHARFVMEKVALGQFYRIVHRFYSVYFTSNAPYSYAIFVYMLVLPGQKGEVSEPFLPQRSVL